MIYTIFVGLEMIQEMDDQMQSIQAWLEKAKDRPKGYVNVHQMEKNHEFRNKVVLQVRLHKRSINLERGPICCHGLRDHSRSMSDSDRLLTIFIF